MHSLISADATKGIDVQYDYNKIEFIILNKLIVGKHVVETEKDRMRKVRYLGELLFDNYLIDDVRKSIKQEKINNYQLEQVNNFIQELVENKENNGIEILRNVYSSLNTFICFLGTNFKSYGHLKFKQFSQQLEIRNISHFVKEREPLSSLTLQNIVEIYELFENEMFELSLSQFDDKYKQNIEEDDKRKLEEFIRSYDETKLPTKLNFSKAIRKFAMRCLFADMDENQSLSVYLTVRIDFWAEDISDDKLEALGEVFPESIKLMHTLGSFRDMIESKFQPKKIVENVKERNNTPKKEHLNNVNVGSAPTKSSKKMHDRKARTKFENL